MVYVHCRGGRGRTGTVVGCHFVRRGSTGRDALLRLAELWKTVAKSAWKPASPETNAQRSFVVAMEGHERGGSRRAVAPSSLRSGSVPSPCIRLPRIGPEQTRLVGNRFVEWWCLPAPEREDERAGLDFGGEPGADAGFFAFKLACLMNEIGQCTASAGEDCGTGTP
jgi:hypothetical protein